MSLGIRGSYCIQSNPTAGHEASQHLLLSTGLSAAQDRSDANTTVRPGSSQKAAFSPRSWNSRRRENMEASAVGPSPSGVSPPTISFPVRDTSPVPSGPPVVSPSSFPVRDTSPVPAVAASIFSSHVASIAASPRPLPTVFPSSNPSTWSAEAVLGNSSAPLSRNIASSSHPPRRQRHSSGTPPPPLPPPLQSPRAAGTLPSSACNPAENDGETLASIVPEVVFTQIPPFPLEAFSSTQEHEFHQTDGLQSFQDFSASENCLTGYRSSGQKTEPRQLTHLLRYAKIGQILSEDCDLADVPSRELHRALKLALSGSVRVNNELHRRAKLEEVSKTHEALCVACQDVRKSVMLLPCKHLCICAGCRPKLEPYRCPVCQAPIQNHVEGVHF